MAGIIYNHTYDERIERLQRKSFEAFARELYDYSTRKTVLAIVPTPRHVSYARRLWAMYAGAGKPPRIMTLDQFVQDVVRTHRPDVRMLTVADCGFVLEKSARRTGMDPGAASITARDLVRWKLEGVNAAEFSRRVYDPHAPSHVKGLRMVADTWVEYEILKGSHSADRADQYLIAAGSLAELIDAHDEDVLLWGLQRDGQLENLIIESIGRSYSTLSVVLSKVYSQEEITRWISAGWQYAPDEESDRIDTGHMASSHTTQVVVCRNRRDEARHVVSVIKEILLNDPMMVDKMCIVDTGAPETMAALMEVSRMSGVPVRMSNRVSLSTTRAASAVHSALQVVLNKWQRVDLERLMSTGCVYHDNIDVNDIVAAARAHRIRGGAGAEDWMLRLRRRSSELERSFVDDEAVRAQVVQQLTRARAALDWLRSTLEIVETVSSYMTSRAFTDYIQHNVLNALGIARAVSTIRASMPAGSASDSHEELIALQAITERYALLDEHTAASELPFYEHAQSWWSMVVATSVVIPAVPRGISVYTPEELQGRQWNTVLVPGLVDGEFPEYKDDSQDVVDESEIDRSRNQGRAMNIRQAVAPGGALVLSFPAEVHTVESIPSTLFPELRHAIPHGNGEVVRVLSDNDLWTVLRRPYRPQDSQEGIAITPDSSATAHNYHQRITTRPVSATSIDVFQSCPHKYFVQKVLAIDVDWNTDDHLSGLERGNAMHAVARAFYQELQTQRVPDAPSIDDILRARVFLDPVRVPEYLIRLQQLYDHHIMLYDTEHTYSRVEYRNVTGTVVDAGILERWLYEEIKAQDEQVAPVMFEKDIAVELDGTQVRARIDRLDAGVVDGELHFRVVDYKLTSGSVPSMTNAREGIASQMTLYSVALQTWFASHGIDATPMSLEYHTFGKNSRSDKEPKVVSPYKKFSPNEIQSKTKDVVSELLPIAQRIRESHYPVRPMPKSCETCFAAGICRIYTQGTA